MKRNKNIITAAIDVVVALAVAFVTAAARQGNISSRAAAEGTVSSHNVLDGTLTTACCVIPHTIHTSSARAPHIRIAFENAAVRGHGVIAQY